MPELDDKYEHALTIHIGPSVVVAVAGVQFALVTRFNSNSLNSYSIFMIFIFP